MELKIFVIEPKYQLNVGYIARVAKNFGIKKLYFVRPRADIRGKKALRFSKHASELLLNATLCKDLDAASGADLVIGTTGIKRRMRFTRMLTPDEMLSYIRQRKVKSAALLLGRDDSGLRREELEQCDVVVHINADSAYPVLNISHALAILLYALAQPERPRKGLNSGDEAREAEKLMLIRLFERMISGKKIRDKRMVRNIFAKTLRKSQLTAPELHALLTAFK